MTVILALVSFLGVTLWATASEAQNACLSKSEARRAVPGAYLYWRGGPKGQRCWYVRGGRQAGYNRPGSINERPVSVTGQRADGVTGQSEITQVEAKSARNLRDYHPGNTPGITPPVNILDHPVWAWVEMARIKPHRNRHLPPKGGRCRPGRCRG